MARARILGDVSSGRDNNLNLMRLLAAAMVALSHSYLLVNGEGGWQPMKDMGGLTLGHHAVNIFFVVSGFLVVRSWHRSESVVQFGMARATRIFPALTICVLITAFVALPLVSALPLAEYFSSPQTLLYVPLTASLATPGAELPGVFDANPVPNEVNGSLWTLRYEVFCYGVLAVLGMFGAFSSRLKTLAVFALLGLPLLFLSLVPTIHEDYNMVQHFVRFGLCFGIGVLAHEFRDRIPLHLSGVLLLLATVVVLHETAFFAFTLYVFIAYGSLWFAFVPSGRIRTFNKVGDVSYGLYIYAFPVQQLLLNGLPALAPLELFIATLVVTIPIAALSWVYVEKPFLTHKDALYAYAMRKARWLPAPLR